MAAALPGAGAAAASAIPNAGTSRPKAQNKSSTPSPSPRRRDPPNSARSPLSSCEKHNAAAPRLPRAKEVASRYLASSSSSASSASAVKGSSFPSASASSSSKGASFASGSASTAPFSSSSTANSSQRRFRSPLPAPRPSIPAPLPQTCLPNRSKSVDRARTTDTAARRASHDPPELTTAAARSLRTTTRSLSVSFQGESFSYQASKARPVSPSPTRKPSPERRAPLSPATPARSSLKSESSRPLDNHHRWPAAKTQQFNPLTRSLDCSAAENDSILAAIRSLRQAMVLNEDSRRASFDAGELCSSFDTDSLSSGGNSGSYEFVNRPSKRPTTPRGRDVPARFLQEKGSRLYRLPEPGTPKPSSVAKSIASSKLVPTKKPLVGGLLSPSLVASSPHHSFPRYSSPGKLRASSPKGMPGIQRDPSSPVTRSSSAISPPSNAASNFSFSSDTKRGKIGERQFEDAHQLRLLYNRYLQWRLINAQANSIFLVQKLNAEKYLYNAWLATVKMHEYTSLRKLQLQSDRQHLKLNSILMEQMSYLDEWSLVNQEHSIALSGALETLKATTIQLPMVEGTKVDFQELRNAIGSALDLMQAMGNTICALLSKVEESSSMVSELAELATKEQALVDQCKDLLTMVAAMHVKHCSSLGYISQLRRPSLIQL